MMLRVTEAEGRGLQVPMLGVAGELDVYRPYSERMRGVAPDFMLVVLAGLDHGGPAFYEALAGKATSFFSS